MRIIFTLGGVSRTGALVTKMRKSKSSADVYAVDANASNHDGKTRPMYGIKHATRTGGDSTGWRYKAAVTLSGDGGSGSCSGVTDSGDGCGSSGGGGDGGGVATVRSFRRLAMIKYWYAAKPARSTAMNRSRVIRFAKLFRKRMRSAHRHW
jgi:hypothetical protein